MQDMKILVQNSTLEINNKRKGREKRFTKAVTVRIQNVPGMAPSKTCSYNYRLLSKGSSRLKTMPLG